MLANFQCKPLHEPGAVSNAKCDAECQPITNVEYDAVAQHHGITIPIHNPIADSVADTIANTVCNAVAVAISNAKCDAECQSNTNVKRDAVAHADVDFTPIFVVDADTEQQRHTLDECSNTRPQTFCRFRDTPGCFTFRFINYSIRNCLAEPLPGTAPSGSRCIWNKLLRRPYRRHSAWRHHSEHTCCIYTSGTRCT